MALSASTLLGSERISSSGGQLQPHVGLNEVEWSIFEVHVRQAKHQVSVSETLLGGKLSNLSPLAVSVFR